MGTISQNLSWFGGSGDWADATDWQDPPGTPANLTPAPGDTMTIAAGDVAISAADAASFGTLDDETLYLGAAQFSGMPTLDTSDETLGSGFIIGQTGDTLDAAWTARGATDFQGALNITGIDSGLTLGAVADAQANPCVFTIDFSGYVTVGGEGSLDFTSGAMNVVGDLVVKGQATFEAGASLSAPTGPSASLDAPGVLQRTEDASLAINGSETGVITFAGSDATLRIGNLAAFEGSVEGFAASDTIALTGLLANGYSYDPTTQILTLKDNGTAVGAVEIDGSYATNAFSVTTDGAATDITLAGPVIVKDVLPVAIFATAGQPISLATILTEAFGSTANFGTVYVSYNGAAILANNSWGYWSAAPSQQTVTKWTVPGNATKLTPESTLGAAVTDSADTYLDVGNVVSPSADIKIPVVSQNGAVTEYL
jgi:hypothetical protein